MDRKKTHTGVRPHGKSIQIDFLWNGQRYRERVALPPSSANLNFAAKKRAAIQHEIECGTFEFSRHFPNSRKSKALAKANSITVAAALNDWLVSKKKLCAVSTFRDYESAIEHHLKPQFGHKFLSEMTTGIVRDWIALLPISAKRTSNVLTPLRGVFDDAYLEGRIQADPLARIRNRVSRPDEPLPLDADQVERVLTAARHPQHRNFLEFAIYSGLRTSEQIALRWTDIDFEKGVVRISRAKVRRQLKTPKTNSGFREIKLNSRTRAALSAQRRYFMPGVPEIFLNPRTKEPWTDDGPLRKTVWLPALKEVNLSPRRLYETRHTFASIMLTLGEDPFWVSQQMGHSSLQQTLKAYARWIPNVNAAGGQRLESYLSQRSHSASATN